MLSVNSIPPGELHIMSCTPGLLHVEQRQQFRLSLRPQACSECDSVVYTLQLTCCRQQY